METMRRYFCMKNGNILPASSPTIEDIVWCDIIDPTDDDLIEIAEDFDVNLNDLQDCLEEDVRPRYNFEYLLRNHFLLLRTVVNYEFQYKSNITEPVGIFHTKMGKIITIQPHLSPNFESFFSSFNNKLIESSWVLFFELLQFFVTNMNSFSEKFAGQVRKIQTTMLKSHQGQDIQDAFQFDSLLIFFNTAMLGNINALKTMFHKIQPDIEKSPNLMELFDTVQTDLEQVHSISSIYRDLLNNSLDAFSSVINNNLTNVMKIVGSLTLIIAIPTAVFSLFGMNFAFPGGSNIGGDHLPFWIAIISSAVLSLMAWIFAKKHNWL